MAKKSTKLEALKELFLENDISADTVEISDSVITEMKKMANTVTDYRHPSYVRHLLSDIIMITFFALLGNANEWGEIESFAKSKEKWLRKYLELPFGIPTDDTIRIIIGNINAEHFFHLTVQLLLCTVNDILALSGKAEEIHETDILSVDGKESRGSGRQTGNSGKVRPLQTLNIYSNQYGMCLAQEFIKEKTNEIPAAQELLRLMDLRNSIITADAMNCQKETTEVIRKSKGDYVLALKGNQGNFHLDVQDYFEDSEVCKKLQQQTGCYYKTTEKEHGGIAVREYYITEDIKWYSEKKLWKDLKSIGMVRKTMKYADGRKKSELRYYICSIGADGEQFERAVRKHWGVENNLHWVLDFTFQDDKNTSMAKNGAKNLQIMKKIVMSLLNLVKSSYGLSMKRIRYVLSLNYEEEIEKMFGMLDIKNIETMLESNGKSSEK